RTGPGVQVFVRTPDGEVDIPVMKLQRQIADGMGEIEAREGTLRMSRVRDARAIERLAGAVLNAGPEHERELAAEFFDLCLDVLDAQRFFASARREFDQRFLGIEFVPREL